MSTWACSTIKLSLIRAWILACIWFFNISRLSRRTLTLVTYFNSIYGAFFLTFIDIRNILGITWCSTGTNITTYFRALWTSSYTLINIFKIFWEAYLGTWTFTITYLSRIRTLRLTFMCFFNIFRLCWRTATLVSIYYRINWTSSFTIFNFSNIFC